MYLFRQNFLLNVGIFFRRRFVVDAQKKPS